MLSLFGGPYCFYSDIIYLGTRFENTHDFGLYKLYLVLLYFKIAVYLLYFFFAAGSAFYLLDSLQICLNQ